MVCTVIGSNLYKDTDCVAHISGSIYLTPQLIFVCQLNVSWMIWPIQWVSFCYRSIVSSLNVCPAETHTCDSRVLPCMPVTMPGVLGNDYSFIAITHMPTVRILSMHQIEICNPFLYLEPFNCASKCMMRNRINSVILEYLKPCNCVQTNELWLVLKLSPINYLFTNYVYLIYMYKQDLALNNIQGLICHKTQPTDNYKSVNIGIQRTLFPNLLALNNPRQLAFY